MNRATQLLLSHATLTAQITVGRWMSSKQDLPSTLSLLGALSALCRELTAAAAKQALTEDKVLPSYGDSANLFAVFAHSINYVDGTNSYKRQHQLGLAAHYGASPEPLDVDGLNDIVVGQLAALERSTERMELSLVRTLSSLYVFADAAYEVAAHAYCIAAPDDYRYQSIGELVNVANHFRNNCNPR